MSDLNSFVTGLSPQPRRRCGRLYILVNYEGLQNFLAEYQAKDDNAFICIDSPFLRFFVEDFLQESRVLYLKDIPAHVQTFGLDPENVKGQTLAHQLLAPECRELLENLPAYLGRLRDFMQSLPMGTEVCWYHRLDLPVTCALSVARTLGLPLLYLRGSLVRQLDFRFWPNSQLTEINPAWADFIGQLNRQLEIRQSLADVYLAYKPEQPAYTGISPHLEGIPVRQIQDDNVLQGRQRLKSHLEAMMPELVRADARVMYVDDGFRSDSQGVDWPATAGILRAYFSSLPRDLKILVKPNPRHPPTNELVRTLFPGKEVTMLRPEMPAELFFDHCQAVFFGMSNSMTAPTTARRLCLGNLVHFADPTAENTMRIYLRNWAEISGSSLEFISSGPRAADDLDSIPSFLELSQAIA